MILQSDLITICQAIQRGDLTWQLISDRPSQLSKGMVYINHDRLTGLLEEQDLPLSDISTAQLEQLLRPLHPIKLIIQSEYSWDATTHSGTYRGCYRISLTVLNQWLNYVLSRAEEEIA